LASLQMNRDFDSEGIALIRQWISTLKPPASSTP
jgi:hypothetical protein